MSRANKKTESSLLDALAYCSLPRLPEVDNGEDVWIKALAKVVKSNGIEYYVYVERDINTLEPRIVRDFGDVLSIAKVVEYYPFSFLKTKFMPTFKDDSEDARIKYLAKFGLNTEEEYKVMTVEQMDEEIIKIAIRRQLEHEAKR